MIHTFPGSGWKLQQRFFQEWEQALTPRRYPGMPHTIIEPEIESARPIIEGLTSTREAAG